MYLYHSTVDIVAHDNLGRGVEDEKADGIDQEASRICLPVA
jgi:hypothetical protein